MRIAIVGLGLIGGSLALDLRSPDCNVLGISHRQETCEKAQQIGAVDDYLVLSDNSKIAPLESVEIVFICTPIDKIAPTLKRLIPYLSSETIVTDVGSVKTSIVAECSQLWENFLGGHPMAGTEKSGIDAAYKGLFKGAAYVFTPTNKTSTTHIEKLKDIAEHKLGSIVYCCSPQEHDRAVALISHLPVMVSASLINTCISETNSAVLKLAKNLASSGFRDTSRVGGGNPELGLMMAHYNRENLLETLFQYRDNLDRIIQFIEQEDWENLHKIFQSTRQARPEFLK
jgi:arogenate dehydrogenase (NADP+)